MTSLPDDVLLLDNQLCFTLYAASRKVISLYNPMLKKLDITYTQYLTMIVLWEHKKLTVKEAGNFLMLDSGTLTPLLKKLEEKGLVSRLRSKQDERNVFLEITQKGLDMKKDALQFLPGILCSTSLNTNELVEMRERLKQLIQAIQIPASDNC